MVHSGASRNYNRFYIVGHRTTVRKTRPSAPKNRLLKKRSKNKSKNKSKVEAKTESTIAAKRSSIVHCIQSLPKGRVSTYGAIARAAGWAGAARQVARVLRQVQGLPWQRVIGSGGAIKCPGEYAAEQRFRLQMEGVTFRGLRVNMKMHEHKFAATRTSSSRTPRKQPSAARLPAADIAMWPEYAGQRKKSQTKRKRR